MIKVEKLKKTFTPALKIFRKTSFAAVNNVSFSIDKGKVLGLVGESGCGKSTLAQMLIRIIEPDEGSIVINDTDIARISKKEMFELRKNLQIIFQHPESSLNPRMKIFNSMVEPLRIHKLANSKEQEKRVVSSLLEKVGLNEEYLNRFPHELSGGEVQRFAIARVLSLNPKVIIADEPTSMLDVSVQAQILQLLKKMQKEYDITLLFISHDLEVVSNISDHLAVMHEGKIVEYGETRNVCKFPQHPYAKQLVKSFTDFSIYGKI